MKNIKNIIFVVAMVTNLHSNIVGMDSSSKKNIYPVWTIEEREAALVGIKRNQRIDHENHIALLSNCTGASSTSTKRFSDVASSISDAVKAYNQKQAMVDLTQEQIQEKRAQIIAKLTQQNISSLKASTIMECQVYKKIMQNSEMSERDFRNMTKELLKNLPDLLIRDDL